MAQPKDPNAEHARVAAEIEPDVGFEQVGSVYGKALLSAAESAGCTEAVLEEFDTLVFDVVAKHPRFEAVLASALVSHDEKIGILDRVFGSSTSPMLLNFLKVVSNHGRLDCLRPIHSRTRELYDEMRGRVPVRLTTATPVTGETADRIARDLKTTIGGEPVVSRDVDPDLIGGAVVRVGDTVYDGSIANQLKVIREQMIDRSVHEIQSRRDRFRYPEGD